MERNPEPKILDDLVDIDPLNDAELLQVLKMRYLAEMIYVNCGPTMLMTNPYKGIKGLTSDDKRAFYRQYALNGGKAD
jgi:myosin heavy subunit